MKHLRWMAAIPLVLLLCAAEAVSAGVPENLETNPVPNGLGLALQEYAFSWATEGQNSYQLLVASDEKKLAADVGDLWNSGRRYGEKSDAIVCRGKAFPAGASVWWKVRVWNQGGEASDWSPPASIDVPANDVSAKPVPRPTAVEGKIGYLEGRLGEAAELDAGVTISAADYDALRPTEGTTIAVWIKPTHTPDTWQCLYRKEDGARRLLAIGKEGPHWGLWAGFVINGKYVEFGAPFDPKALADGQWHHVAASFDGEAIRLFVDGGMIGEEVRKGKLDTGDASPATIGSFGGSAEKFHGGMDDLRIYGTGLSESAIARLAAGNPDVENASLAAHWTFDGSVNNAATHTPETARNRIVLVGGTLIYEMEEHAYFETAVTARWPHHDITFRNLGWPADDVFGTARGEFGSAQNTRSWKPPGAERGFGYRELLRQVREAKPTTLVIGYGAEAAYADTPEKMADFELGYRRLIADLEATGANLILLAPIEQKKHLGIIADEMERNERLQKAADFIFKLAEESGHLGIDLFREGQFGAWFDNRPQNVAYRNGIHLNAFGHRILAARIGKWLDIPGAEFYLVPSQNRSGGEVMVIHPGVTAKTTITKRGYRWDAAFDQLPVGQQASVRSPWEEDQSFRVTTDGVHVNTIEEGHKGQIERGPDFEQAEELRQKIIEKNRFHRYKLRPINKAYIFLFRRHEMGHLAYEMEDFDTLIAGHERAIAHLRVPRTHAWEIERIDPWKSPRDYPEHEVPKDIPAPDIEAELKAFTVADGFEVKLFARNPMISNPINLNWDTRGRAWVSTSTTYPHIKPGRAPNDRIVILEDRDGDGVADKHSVFAEGLTVPHSVMPVPGGAYVCSTTEFLFLADDDGDDVADSRRVVFSGFGNADVHHMIHGLRWSPWGDLHFTQSIYINSFVETPHGPRRMNGSGIWRFRPETERLEAFAVGMVNPWGFALNRWGQSFGTDGAGGSGPHYVFPGAAFQSAVGAHRVLSGLIPGKPKNTAAEFVSGRHMPDHWQGSLLANDFRANRTVRYELEESGSGYTAKEVETVLRSSHRSFRPVDIKMGPEGAVYVVDWYNPIIDHGEVDFHHPMRDKAHGRIWRITAKGRPLVARPKIAGAAAGELLDMLKAPEQYTRMQANRELASRSCQGLGRPIQDWLEALDPSDPDFDHHRLEVLWMLMAHRAPRRDLAEELLGSSSHHVRAAAVRVISNWHARAGSIDKPALLARAVEDEHPQVRLEAVNALREIGTLKAANIALRALGHPTDNNIDFALELTVRALRDVWLPAMQSGKPVFDGVPSRLAFALKEANDPRAIERLVEVVKAGEIVGEDLSGVVTTVVALGNANDVGAMLAMAGNSPNLLPAIARGAAENPAAVPDNVDVITDILTRDWQPETGIAAAKLYGLWNVRHAAVSVGTFLGSAENPGVALAMAEALARLGDVRSLQMTMKSVRPHVRVAAAAGLAGADPGVAAPDAVTVLASLDDSALAEAVFAAFIGHQNGPDALAMALKETLLPEKIAIAGLRLAHASGRELSGLIAALNTAGLLKPVAQNLSPDERRNLLADAAKSGDPERGREIYHRKSMLCTTCHIIDRKGGKLGPDLTTVGSYMTPESLLESLLNPSTDIKQGYETVVVTRKGNAVVSGLLQRKTENATLVRDPSGTVVSIPSNDIEKIDSSPVSLMPPGLTAQLRRDELADLMKFLTSLGKPSH